METVLKNVAVGYARLFPELLDRFHQNGDLTIVDLIAEKAIEKIEEKFIDISNIKKIVVDLLNKGL